MGWVSRSNPALVAAMIASFSASNNEVRALLAPFTAQDWACTEYWLDTSGLALYFLESLQSRGLNDAVDRSLLAKLQQKLAENKVRLDEMLRDLAGINRDFQKSGLCYANLKGFTLAPHSCPDVALRHISDFDFLVDPADIDRACAILEQHGYRLAGVTARSLEFKTAGPIRTSLAGQYATDARRSAELHLAAESVDEASALAGRDPRLTRLEIWQCPAGSFPALAPADQLIGQAVHLLAHLRHEHTRASWLLEYRHHVRTRARDTSFWRLLRARTEEEPAVVVALGLSTLLATQLFGPFAPQELRTWTVDTLPPMVRLWAEMYGRRAVLADVPGTKLYLLLESALREVHLGRPAGSTLWRLVPMRGHDRIAIPAPQTSLRERLRGEFVELQFLFFRFRFHLREGLRYLAEWHRWMRLSAGHEELREHATCENCHFNAG